MDKYYSKTHEWVEADGDEAVVGVSEFAASEMGDITYAELPQKGADLIVGDVAVTIDSVQAPSSEVFSPISGTVSAVNHNLDDAPDLISTSPEHKGWLFKLENIDLTELDDLMDAAAYKKYLKTLD